MSWQPSWSRRSWLTADSQRALVVCDERYGASPAFLEPFAGAGLWHLAEMPRDTKVWPLLETDGQTKRSDSGFGGFRGTKVRWSPIFSCCVRCCLLIVCQFQRFGS